MVYVSPPQPPSPVPEGSEEGSSPKGSSTDIGNSSGPDLASVSVFFHLLLCCRFVASVPGFLPIGVEWSWFSVVSL